MKLTQDFLRDLKPYKLPDMPQPVVTYLCICGPEDKNKFNAENPGFWDSFDRVQGDKVGYFAALRICLGHNESWIELLNDAVKQSDNADVVDLINKKIKEFCETNYVGPAFRIMPYFSKWVKINQTDPAESVKVDEQKEMPNFNE